jgi:exonuclease III
MSSNTACTEYVTVCAVQVILVGDFNIAAAPADVHEAISWEGLYHPSELQALQDLTGPQGCACVDSWRHTHPHTRDVYTVWEERKSARSFNVVSGCCSDNGNGSASTWQCTEMAQL